MWYRNTYATVRPLPTLAVFLKAFKDHFLASYSDEEIIKRLAEIEQGSKTTSQYSTEFQALVIQLGKTDPRFAKHDYMRGLNVSVRKLMLGALTGEESLVDLCKRAATVFRNLKYAKSLEPKRSSSSAETKTRSWTSSTSTARTSSASATSVSSVNREMDSSGKFSMKLTEPEKDYLRKNNGCFNCRKVKVNHIANDCREDHSGSGDLV